MISENKKIVMFDFDGVLVNTLEFSYKIHTRNNKDFTWERFKSFSDGNFHEGFDKAVHEENFVAIDNFYEHYEKELKKLTIHEVLNKTIAELSKKYILLIISSTDGSSINKFLKKEKLDHCFLEIYGHDFNKSKVFKIKKILEKYNISPQDTVLITDTLG